MAGAAQSVTDNNYAGLDETPMTNLSIEVYEGPRRIYDNYVVMYRAMVADEWLDWVSNGQPPVMQTIQAQFQLPGKLDTAATEAGWGTRGNIQALEIRVFEEVGYVSPTFEKQFQEVTDFTKEYFVDRTWHTLHANVAVDQMDGVRLVTNSGDFYLKYKVWDRTHDWLPGVLSTSSDEYAGYPEYPITNLAIDVYNGGYRVYDDYVVMVNG